LIASHLAQELDGRALRLSHLPNADGGLKSLLPPECLVESIERNRRSAEAFDDRGGLTDGNRQDEEAVAAGILRHVFTKALGSPGCLGWRSRCRCHRRRWRQLYWLLAAGWWCRRFDLLR